MPTHKPSLHHVTTSQLGELTARKVATIKRRLQAAGIEPVRVDGRSVWWDARAALAVLFGSGEGLDLSAERAALANVQRRKGELDLEQRRGELIPAAEVERVMVAAASGISMRMQGLPSKAAPDLHAAGSIAEVERILREHVHEALAELADLGAQLGQGEPAAPGAA